VNAIPTRSNISFNLLMFLAVLVLLAPFGTAHAQTFGKTQIGTLTSNGLAADYKRGAKFTLADGGILQTLCAYLDGNGGASGQQAIRLVIYKDSNGVPLDKIAEANPMTLVSGAIPSWYCAPTPSAPMAAGNYWIVIQSGGTAGVVRDYYDGPANWYGNADAYSDGASAQFGAGNAGTGTMSLYAEYAPPESVGVGGRTSVGLPSSGLSANYKRASSFTISQTGRLSSLAAYLDGNGGTSGSQTLRLALYADANGVPGSKITEGAEIAIHSGDAAQWKSVAVPAYLLTPGRYWIALHSGGTAGVIRDYGGNGGNSFYANADTYSDGASSPFGSGSAGTGTLSAFVTFDLGPYETRTLGRTDVGPTPSAGLTANRQRGSYFFTNEFDAVVTNFYAYLDGNGGAAGSQQLRMDVYVAGKTGNPGSLIAQSEIVTIAAGRAPGWVRFPVVPAALDAGSYYGFYITIHSGGTEGVARVYGGGPNNNWIGWADSFADGAVQYPPGWSFGTGTLSVKLEYTSEWPR